MQQMPFNNYNKERSKKQWLYFIFLAVIPTIIIACVLYIITGYLSPEDPNMKLFIALAAGALGIVISLSLVDYKLVMSESSKFNIARTEVGDERMSDGSDLVSKSLKFLGHETEGSSTEIKVDGETLVQVCRTVNMHTVCNVRKVAKENGVSNICIVVSSHSYKRISHKAKKLADKYNIQTVNYSDILTTIYDRIEPDSFEDCEE